ncbi:porin family protein [Flavobacterium capsici]|uniref:PorT family protein n=1 Tax=Flavobacterium capsici TaxID=3075618 RepID=A0AA96EZ66_9FLAO|nr:MULTISPECIES: PorT family protein [unclassified Flavobacterium]WNM19645.1 PorT family protein [Flavobacterium sp. PMR2A8]WNM21034.1 PorT family protein [Flavobacterium sp. PMTSA4]
MNKLFTLIVLCCTTISFAQYGYRDGNRIGISAGVSQTTLFTNNFTASPELGFAGGLSVRGNYYNNWSMIYGMQFFSNNFNLESTFNQKIKYNLQGVQVRILFSYNVVEDHVSLDFGPVLQVNGKLKVATSDENKILKGTLLQADQIIDISPVSGNFYLGVSAGNKTIRAVIFYEYGFTNILNRLNKDDALKVLNNGDKFKGNLGTINGQVIINL